VTKLNSQLAKALHNISMALGNSDNLTKMSCPLRMPKTVSCIHIAETILHYEFTGHSTLEGK